MEGESAIWYIASMESVSYECSSSTIGMKKMDFTEPRQIYRSLEVSYFEYTMPDLSDYIDDITQINIALQWTQV